MIVAVTGGTRFIGGRPVQHLATHGDTVRLLTRRNVVAPGYPPMIELHKCDFFSNVVTVALLEYYGKPLSNRAD